MVPRLEIRYRSDAFFPPLELPSIRVAEDAVLSLQEIRLRDREEVWALHLDHLHRPLARELLAVGGLGQAVIRPREVFKGAILQNSAGLILAHNHPSGDPAPSAKDRELTRVLEKAGEILGIPVLDHLVLGARGWASVHGASGVLDLAPRDCGTKPSNRPREPTRSSG